MNQIDLDDRDQSILEELQRDGRVRVSDLARRIGLSQPATTERIKRLEDRGVIEGYGVRINLPAVGMRMSAIIRLKTTHDQIKACLNCFSGLANVIEVHRVTGDDCFVLKVLVSGPEQLVGIVDTIGRFGPVTTSVVLKSEPGKPISRGLLGGRTG